MTKRIRHAVLGVAALALGGSTLAQAGSTPVKSAPESTAAPDLDTIQSGDQTTPDTPPARTVSKASKTGLEDVEALRKPGAGLDGQERGGGGACVGGAWSRDRAQQRWSLRPPNESGGSAETPEPAREKPGSETPNDDGPGGHADEPGNPNADHQFNGQE